MPLGFLLISDLPLELVLESTLRFLCISSFRRVQVAQSGLFLHFILIDFISVVIVLLVLFRARILVFFFIFFHDFFNFLMVNLVLFFEG